MTENNNVELENNILELIDENGEAVNFELLSVVTYEGSDYLVLAEAENPDSEEVVILKVEEGENEDDVAYVSVEDEAVLDAVFQQFVAEIDGEEDEDSQFTDAQ